MNTGTKKSKRKNGLQWLAWCMRRGCNITTLEGVHAAAKSLQSCPTLCDPIDGSPPGSPVSGSLHVRTLEWAAISFSNVKVKSENEVAQLCPTLRDPMDCTHQAPPSMGFSRQEYWSGVPLLSPRCACIVSINFAIYVNILPENECITPKNYSNSEISY